MSISWDPRNKRWRFKFNRVIAGRRFRASRLLPAGWSKAKAHEFDQAETGRLFDLAAGGKRDPLIEEAVSLYIDNKTHLKSYKSAVEHLGATAWAYSGKHMSELANVAGAIVKEQTAKGMKPATIKNRLALLKAACRYAWKKHNLTKDDPTGRLQMPTVRNERHVYATREEMLALAKFADTRELRIMIRAAFYTGMRLGELRRVEVQGDMLLLRDTKNGDLRAVPAHPRIRCLLPYLPLPNPNRFYQHGFKKVREMIGYPHLHIHDLRHSAASEMVNAGVDLYTVGQVLGHRDSRSTQRYSHLTAHTLQEAVSKIGWQKRSHNDGGKAA